MNRLWVRLSLSFSAIILSGVVIILALLLSGGGFPGIIRVGVARTLDEPEGFVDRLTQSFAQSESWEDVISQIDDLRETYRTIGFPIELGLIAKDNTILHLTDPTFAFRMDFANDITSLPIMSNGEAVAYLQVDLIDPGRGFPAQMGSDSALQEAIVNEIQRTILLVVIMSAIIGICAGTIVSRYLTIPLGQLAQAAQTIRDKKSYHRVSIDDSSIELSEVTEAFNQMLDALDHAETLRRNLVADVAHELRTPLSVLQGNIYAILDDVYPVNKEQVSRLYEQTRILSRLVNDLHEISQAEANQLPLQQSITDIRLMVDERIDTFAPLGKSKGLILSSYTQTDLPAIKVDPIRIEQVLNNLINNAIIHTSSGGEIKVSTFVEGEQLAIQVKDTGKGIPKDQLETVFERFYRVDRNRTRAEGGTGLGLAIVKAIVTAHQGTVSVTSSGIKGEGSIFTVLLPL